MLGTERDGTCVEGTRLNGKGRQFALRDRTEMDGMGRNMSGWDGTRQVGTVQDLIVRYKEGRE